MAAADRIADVSKESHVLLIYTGGLLTTADGTEADANRKSGAGDLASYLRQSTLFHEKTGTVETDVDLELPCAGSDKKVRYAVVEYEPPLDSSNMSTEDWQRIGGDIEHQYYKYDGFVLVQGTDTMCYTASALSFMLENLAKPVIVTGGDQPLSETRGDARDNLLGALTLAGRHKIPEVTIYYNHELYRGNRCSRMNAGVISAIASPNFPPLATVGSNIEIKYKAIFRQKPGNKFVVHSSMNPNVCLLRMFPNISLATVQAFLQAPVMGVVLQTYGAGNLPNDRPDIVNAFREATFRGIIIVNITQCVSGGVTTAGKTGSILRQAGILPGSDMTAEAALTKLSYVLSKMEWDVNMKREMLKCSIRGELTSNMIESEKNWDLIHAITQTLNTCSRSEEQQLHSILFPAIVNAAVLRGDLNKVDEFISLGVGIPAQDCDNRTALHVACSAGNLNVVDYLLRKGLDVESKDKFGRTALNDAIHFDHHDIIHMLVKCGARIADNADAIGDKLCAAAARGNLRRLQSLRLAGADMGQPDLSGRTALHLAVLRNHVQCVVFLLDAGVAPSVVDMLGQTPVDIAMKMSFKHIRNLLEPQDDVKVD